MPGPEGDAADGAIAPLARVDLAALSRNVRRLRERAGPADLLVAVKADAYGHGLVPVARALERDGVRAFGVATPDEALALRRAGVRGRVLLFGPVRGPVTTTLLRAGIDLTIAGPADLDEVAGHAGRAAATGGPPARLHLKVDTGMGRLGLPPDRTVDLARAIVAAAGCEFTAAWTHFARADEPGDPTTRRQLDAFLGALDALDAAGARPRLRHASNSAALLTLPEARLDLVRPGIAVYGHVGSDAVAAEAPDLEPVMTLTAPVVHVKRVDAGTPVSYGHVWRAPRATTVATVRIGYGDGYPRALTGRGTARLAGVDAPVAGTVCMDQTMFDAGDAPVGAGDRAVLFGPGGPDLRELAARIDTIPYELLTRVTARVRRHYVGAGVGEPSG